MTHGVNLRIENWRWTGETVPTPQAKVDLSIEWRDESGAHSWSGALTFPNDLQLVPVAWLKEMLEDLLIRAARVRLGLDEVA